MVFSRLHRIQANNHSIIKLQKIRYNAFLKGVALIQEANFDNQNTTRDSCDFLSRGTV
jgi:hypothetical protein